MPIKYFQRRKLCREAVSYLQKTDYPALIQASQKIQEFHINEKQETDYGTVYWHHLPLKDKDAFYLNEDNWDISDTDKETLLKLRKKLEEYFRAVYYAHHYNENGEYISNVTVFRQELLPAWIVFPFFDAMSIAWRMGDGEEYMELFLSFLDTLTDEQQEQYFKAYPLPEYMEVNRFEFNIMNHKSKRKPNGNAAYSLWLIKGEL